MSGDEKFPKSYRIRSQADFERAYAGVRAMDARLVVHGVRNELDHTRLGISLSRKVGSAPVRNRWKRLIRESFRRMRQRLPTGIDLVVRPRKGALCAYDGIQESLAKLIKRLARDLERIT